ncbi:MAG TPA: hypothetical protein VFX43_11775 [Chitinophagaceae bacterium]|nr:hypothetical protein [Chitinophagaceae bacterium]
MYLRRLLFTAILLSVAGGLTAQVMIHSHNDYDHAHPFWGAFKERANSIEADVFPVNGRLMVAHAKKQITASRTLDSMYLSPIVRCFGKHHNRTVSGDTTYRFYLMIDIKEHWDRVLPLLIQKLQAHPACFDRKVNPMAVQVFISGDRPADTTFHHYPSVIMFDGLPGKRYRPADRRKIVMISTDFHLYSDWDGKGKLPRKDAEKITRVITGAHHLGPGKGKPVRFWGAPDTRNCWETLLNLGADVLNTDQVKACRNFLLTRGS